MPHIIVECSANVAAITDVQGLVDAVHERALASGLVPPLGLRTRAVCYDAYRIADGEPDNMFVAATVRLGPGRSEEDKHRLIDDLVDVIDGKLLAHGEKPILISVECQELDPALRVNRNHLRALRELEQRP